MKKLLFISFTVCLLIACNTEGVTENLKNPITITFDARGGDPVNPITVERGATIKLPKVKERKGYEFSHYSIDGKLESIIMPDDKINATQDLNIRLVWAYLQSVSNITCTIIAANHYQVTWDNPTDENFSHVYDSYAGRILEHWDDYKEPLLSPYSVYGIQPINFTCFDLNMNPSPAVIYIAAEHASK
jgi:hypothetical protein